ncbi:hypothetical protein [Methylocella tundrae]|uniref:hypothetical protein n=1 Tax=Methylocella tundrae TaxID=227605 RepID=UPI00157AC480|nr:hypothetical protein [Methylocella tundrae]
MKRLLVIVAAALLLAFSVSDEAAARGGRGVGVGHGGVGVGARGVGVVRHPAARAAVRRCAAGVTCY